MAPRARPWRLLRALGWVAGLSVARAAVAAEPPAAASGVEEPRPAEPEGAAAAEPIEVQVVGSAPTAGSHGDPSLAAFVLRREDLGRPGLSAAEALAAVPGVQSARSGGAAELATASVRGASSAELPIYLGGVRLNDDVTGSVDLSTLPLWMMHRIEIYRGHAPQGADRLGIAGAMVFEPLLPAGTHASAALSGGSFGEREARAMLSVGRSRTGALVAVRHAGWRGDFPYLDDGGTRFDDHDDVVRHRQNADAAELDVWTVGRAATGRWRSTMVANAFSRDAGAPGLQRIAARFARARLRRWLAGASNVVDCDGRSDAAHRACRVQLDANVLVTRYRLVDPLGEIGPERGALSRGERFGQRIRLIAEADWLQLAMGLTQELSALGVDRANGDDGRSQRHLMRSELGAVARPGGRLAVVTTAALECHSTATERSGRACGVLTPVGRVGVRWQLVAPVALTANAGRYVRVPTLGELYGVSASVRGNAALRPEQGVTVDAGLSTAGGGGPLSAYGQVVGFVRFADDLIAYQRSSFGAVRPYNAASARVLGAEVAAGVQAWRRLRLRLALTLLDPRDVTEDRLVVNDLLPHRSRLLLSPELELSSGRWGLLDLDQATLGARFAYRSARVADPAGLIVLAADGQLDLDASLSFMERRFGVRGRISNLLDAAAVDVVGYPLPGRAYHLSAEVRW